MPPSNQGSAKPLEKLRQHFYTIIFESDTPAGKAFDVGLLFLILLSILLLMLESVEHYQRQYSQLFRLGELAITALFTIEYLLRVWCTHKRWQYITSFFGVIDLIAILPAYLSSIIVGIQYLVIIRTFRLP